MNHLFPDCKIHTMPQRSEAWYEIRKDKLTASIIGSWLAEAPVARITVDEIKTILDRFALPYKKSGAKPELMALLPPEMLPRPDISQGSKDARHTSICRIIGAMSNCAVPDQWEVDPDGPPPRNPAMWAIWNGIRQEAAAVRAFEAWSGETILEVGFCEHKSGVAGCSPDGIIVVKPIGFEGKAPMPATHVGYVLNPDSLVKTYGDQCHFSMATTGAQAWWLQSYCPGLPTVRVLIERDDYTERMAAGIDEFAEHLESARDEIASLWDAEFEAKI